MAESNRKKREAKKQAKLEASGVNQYYGIGAVIALGVIGSLGYYIYRTKKGEQPQQNNPKPQPQAHKIIREDTGKLVIREDTGKLVTIVATSEMTREYLIKQKSYQII